MTANIGCTTVESSTGEMPRTKPATKASEHRRITKPIMEKKRRARINSSLMELKSLILSALNKDPTRHSKLEKADILEMTVRHLQKMQRAQMTTSLVNDPNVLNKYRAGYTECASEVSRFLGQAEDVEQGVRQRILGHLAHCVNGLNHMASSTQLNASNKSAFPGMLPPARNSLHVHIPMHAGTNTSSSNLMMSMMASNTMNGSDINNNTATPSSMASSPLSKSLSTPPSSASSTSSHFAFNLHTLHSPLDHVRSLALPVEFYRNQPMSSATFSPGSGSLTSGQFSPANSEDTEMAIDLALGSRKHADDDNVWRPW